MSNVLAILLSWNSRPNDQMRPAEQCKRENKRVDETVQTSYASATRLETEHRQKNKSPLISMKFGDIVEPMCLNKKINFWKNFDHKGTFFAKNAKNLSFWAFFHLKT